MIDYRSIVEQLDTQRVIQLMQTLGAEDYIEKPGYVIFPTICHNEDASEASMKLYYYENTGLFKCFTGCDEFFDPLQLVIKVAKIQWNEDYDLNDAVRWVAQKFGFAGRIEDAPEEGREDWDIFAAYERLQLIEVKENQIVLPEYDDIILSNFNLTNIGFM